MKVEAYKARFEAKLPQFKLFSQNPFLSQVFRKLKKVMQDYYITLKLGCADRSFFKNVSC